MATRSTSTGYMPKQIGGNIASMKNIPGIKKSKPKERKITAKEMVKYTIKGLPEAAKIVGNKILGTIAGKPKKIISPHYNGPSDAIKKQLNENYDRTLKQLKKK